MEKVLHDRKDLDYSLFVCLCFLESRLTAMIVLKRVIDGSHYTHCLSEFIIFTERGYLNQYY